MGAVPLSAPAANLRAHRAGRAEYFERNVVLPRVAEQYRQQCFQDDKARHKRITNFRAKRMDKEAQQEESKKPESCVAHDKLNRMRRSRH